MMKNKKSLLVLIVMIANFALAVGTTSTTPDLLVYSAASAQQLSKDLVLKGKIGEKYAFTMVIDDFFNKSQTGFENFTGRYWYGDGKNGIMKIQGESDRYGEIYLTEYDPKGVKCGEWEVRIDLIERFDTFIMKGTMTNAKGQTFKVYAENEK